MQKDLISKQEAINTIMGQPPEPHYPSWYATQIEKLPPAQPERKTGRWMFGFNNQYLEKYYYCSKCGSRKYMEDKPLDNFCSNCGADMRGEQDD